MDATEIDAEVEAVFDRLAEVENAIVFETANQPYSGFVIEMDSLIEFTELGLEEGASRFYIRQASNDEGMTVKAGLSFFIDGHPHTVNLRADSFEDERAGEEPNPVGLRQDESEEERERKEEIAEELLTEYEDYLSEDEQYRIENRRDAMRLRNLLHIRDRVKAEAKVDPEEEKRLAKAVWNDDRFGRQFNQTDTEMLLDDLDVEFDPDDIRPQEVHKRAKSLLKINR